MIDKLEQALTLVREAFADAAVGAADVSSADLASEVDGAQRVINAACAVQSLRVAQYAGRDKRDCAGGWEDVDHGVGHISEFAADCFGPALGMGSRMADRKVEAAAMLASKLPRTLAAMGAGDLDLWRATIIATELAEASRESCAQVEAQILPSVLPEAPGAVTRRVRRVLGRVDADALRIKAAKERLDRFVRAFPSPVPGLTAWAASLPAADSAACWAAIDELAHQMRGDDPTRTLEQCRADALVDLILTDVSVTTTVTVMVPVQTLTTDEPDDCLERDLIVRAGNPGSTSSPVDYEANEGYTGSWADHEASEGYTGSWADDEANEGYTGSWADHEANEGYTGSWADHEANEGYTGEAASSDDTGHAATAKVGNTAGPGEAASSAAHEADSRFAHLHPWAFTDDFGEPVPDPNPMREPTWQQIAAMGYEIPGIGVIGGDVVAAILAKFDTRMARVLLDERTGVVIETSIEEYLPDKAIRRFIQNRDGHCRFPCCPRNARRCEPDHVIPYSRGGPTTPWNLASLCKHHHRVKHEAGWALTMTREGECTWTDPHGRQYVTHPINHHELAA